MITAPWYRYAGLAPAAVLGGLLVSGSPLLGLRPVLVFALLALPVMVLVRRVAWRSSTSTRPILVSAGIVLLGVMLIGLLVDTALPWVGVDRPLARPVVAVALALAVMALMCWRASVPLTSRRELRARMGVLPSLRFEPTVTLAVLALLTAVIGAVRLNNGAGGGVALVGHLLVAAALVGLLLRRGSEARDGVVIYLSSIALLLATSVRGWYVIGHDIQQEYAVYLVTQSGDHWAPSLLPGAYNACLSLNILPTMVANLTGLSGVVVFKVVAPVVFGLVPVMVYAAARAFAGRFAALLGTVVFVAFPTFSNDMPYLLRQEVAFLFVALAVLVAVHHDLSDRHRRWLVSALGLGVVVSHYSTTYVLIMGLLVAMAGLALERRLLTRRAGADVESSFAHAVLAAPVTVGVLIVATVVWVGPVTHSGGHLVETVKTTAVDLLHGDVGVGSSDLGYSVLPGQNTSPQERVDRYVGGVEKKREASAGPWLIATPTSVDLHPSVAEPSNADLTDLGHALAATGISVSQLNALLRLAAAVLLQLWLVIGVALLVLRRTGPGSGVPTDRPQAPREGAWLALGSLGGIALLVALPGLSVDYGVLRAVQQSLIVTAPAVAVGVLWTVSWFRRRAPVIAGVLVLLIALCLTGVVSSVTGGFPGTLPLANSGQYYDLYFTSPQDQAGMQWVSNQVPRRAVPTLLAADPASVPRLVIAGRGRLDVSADFFPTQLRPGEWLFLDSVNVVKQQAHALYDGSAITYRYPVDQLRSRLDVVYSGPSTQVLR